MKNTLRPVLAALTFYIASLISPAQVIETFYPTNIKPKTYAQIQLNAFPEFIPGAKSVLKYPTKDAKKVLIFIRQAHISPSEDITTCVMNTIVPEIQDDIYKTLDYLVDRFGKLDVRCEGVIDLKPKLDELVRETKIAIDNAKTENEKTQITKNSIAEFYRIASKQYFPKKDSIYSYDRLALEDKINIKPLESWDIYFSVVDLVYKQQATQTEIAKANEIREQDMLSKLDKPMSYIILGAGHSFNLKDLDNLQKEDALSDNIYIWNKEHPDDKLSLIVITPKTFTKFSKVYKNMIKFEEKMQKYPDDVQTTDDYLDNYDNIYF